MITLFLITLTFNLLIFFEGNKYKTANNFSKSSKYGSRIQINSSTLLKFIHLIFFFIQGTAWGFFTLILVSSYTANLAAFVTVERLKVHV